MQFSEQLTRYQDRIEQALDQFLPKASIQPTLLHEAMRYSVLGGGKRIRPIMVYSTAEVLNIPLNELDAAATAIEMIHAYSLIHDDLPAMDDDDLRRGKPTCHVKFDEATAILAGDALQALAFQILSQTPSQRIDAEKRMQLICMMAIASGSRGMAGGQAIDLAATGQNITIAELENMHIHKTGELIRASIMAATFYTDIDEEKHRALDHFSKCLGLAFQIKDDILDVEGDTHTLGKQAGADQQLNKSTYPSLLGLDESKEELQSLYQEGLKSLKIFGDQAIPLKTLAHYIVERQH